MARLTYYQKNKERIREREKSLFESNPTEYRKRRNQAQKKWRDTHKEQVKQKRRKEYKKNKTYFLQRAKDFHLRNKEKVFNHYGRICKCCGEDNLGFLSIDHIRGSGNQHRKSLGRSGTGFYIWLVKTGFPDGFQTLCMNCNWGKGHNGGICPHVGQPTEKKRVLWETQ